MQDRVIAKWRPLCVLAALAPFLCASALSAPNSRTASEKPIIRVRLVGGAGAPLSGISAVQLRVYDADEQGKLLFLEDHAPVAVENGALRLELGAGEHLHGALDSLSNVPGSLWLELRVDGRMARPRLPLSASAGNGRSSRTGSPPLLQVTGRPTFVGPPGPAGPRGPEGPQGPPGPPGRDAVITPRRILAAVGACVGCNLAGADLARADFKGVNLSGADLTRADLHETGLARAYLVGVVLVGANLQGADLRGATLEGNGAGADFSGARLFGATVRRMDLRGAVLFNADLTGVRFEGADLSAAVGIPANTDKASFDAETICPSGVSAGMNGCASEFAALSVDEDGDGEFEQAEIWDADGDGSTYITCTAKDTPDSACKAPGEVIYRDFSDDVNCMIHATCASSDKMERAGTIRLRDGVVYVMWPCWDASEPPGFNDPSHAAIATYGDDLHDDPSDPAYAHCPVNSVGERLYFLAFDSWQGIIEGAGMDLQLNDTDELAARGSGRTIGTTVADDRGRRANAWFDSSHFIRGIQFGFPTWNNADSKGWGQITDSADVEGMNGLLCVCNDTSCSASATDWTSALAAGDQLVMSTTVDDVSYGRVVAAVRVAADGPYSIGSCSNGGVEVPIGGSFSAPWASTNYPVVRSVQAGSVIGNARSDYFDARTRFRSVTVEAQDYWGEEGGDCSETGLWTISGDDASTDDDCDTNPMFGVFGAGFYKIEDIAIKNWHAYSIDGNSNAGQSRLERIVWRFGRGGPALDAGYRWSGENLNIWDSDFQSAVFASFGPHVQWRNVTVRNSKFSRFIGLSQNNRFMLLEDIRFESSYFYMGIEVSCGAEQNTVRTIRSSGRNASLSNGGLIRILCNDPALPVRNNVIEDVYEDPPGWTKNGRQTLAMFRIDTAGNEAAVTNNVFRGFRILDRTPGSCVFGVRDSGSVLSEDVVRYNVFFENSTVAGRMFCKCNSSGDCNTPFTEETNPGTGVKAIGCGNMVGDGANLVPDPLSRCR